MLPNWIIIGVPKASTSSLFRWLADHPRAAGSENKETYYFVDPGTHMFSSDSNVRNHGLAGYEALFAHCDPSSAVILEATPSYIYSDTALQELPKLPGKPSFIVVLREPVAQLRSLHAYFQQNWSWIPADMPFGDFIAAVDAGHAAFRGNELAENALANAWYSDHLRRWTAAAGAERLEIVLFEDLVDDSRRVMQRLAGRMGIDPGFYDSYEFPIENSTYVARSALLQSLNIRLRAHLPRGRIYPLLRKAYRAINTRRPASADRDVECERMLAARFAPMIDELEREFGLDLTKWRHPVPRGQAGAVAERQPVAAPAAVAGLDQAGAAAAQPVGR
ncbi:hypothetical protein [Sphingomonas sp.]|uniref:hypothetical protein n=1 Tax=Sphingomonas sp. TaxID=28214 RepID=UPI00286D72F5|nr:hypothetical protein [Sphingomonas sp.]